LTIQVTCTQAQLIQGGKGEVNSGLSKGKIKSGLSAVMKKHGKWFSEFCILEIYALRDFKLQYNLHSS